jgi:hypothetical protein
MSMPLQDHFRPPLSDDWPWEGVHSVWATHIAAQLNKRLLPADYYAIPHIKMGSPVEIDVSTLSHSKQTESESGGGLAVWAPPIPSLVAAVDFSGLDLFEVQVVRRLGGPQLCATIELVSPANKDRASHRWAFAVKCVSYLQQEVSVLTIDVVTVRTANLHQDILRALEKPGELNWESPTQLSSIAYRIARKNGKQQVEVWPEPITVGAALPTMPLWLREDLALQLSLEDSYVATCEALRLPFQP